MVHRVIQWSTGTMGKLAIDYILDNPNMELVGVKCYSEDKEGVDAGEIIGRGPIGVKATRNIDALLALKPDCVIFSPNDRCKDPLILGTDSHQNFLDTLRILESGANVISPHCPATHYAHLSDPKAFLDRVNAACVKGHSSVHYAGVDPGFFTDQMAMMIASACGTVRQISSWEILDYERIPVPNAMGDRGFGKPLEEVDDEQIAASIKMLWGGVAHLNAEALGVPLDGIEVEIDHWLSPNDFVGVGGFEVREGTVGAHYFQMKAITGGRPFYIMHHVTRMGKASGPDWPRLGDEGGYRVEIDATLPISVDFPLGRGPTAKGCDDAYVMTVSLLLNRVSAVVAASPGYHTYLDLKALTPDHILPVA